MLLRTTLAALVIAAASPALADATTYAGKLGSTDIVLELSSDFGDADETTVGRYLYAKKGIDIPLHVLEATPEKLVLYEELPCTPELCEPAYESGILPDQLRGATWTLSSPDDSHLNGTWTADNGKAPLKLDLTLVGTRPFEPSADMPPYQLSGLPQTVVEGKEELSVLNFPYDYLKATSVIPEAGQDITWDNVTFRYLTDPRVKFPFPQLVKLGTGLSDEVVPGNKRLFTRRYAMMVSGLDCESQAYLGMGWSLGAQMSLGSYAGYPDEQVEVTYLSPTVMSWSESGSLYCGGAYPENHQYITTIDLRTGQDLDLSKIFADSKMGEYSWEPGRSLIDLAIARRSKDEYAFGEDCGIDDLIATNLAVTFRPGDIAVFTLQGLPHVIQACQDDIFEAPLSELRDYLAPGADRYFPSLAVNTP